MAEQRDSKIIRVGQVAVDRIDLLAKREHRDRMRQLDLVIDAGLKAMGEPSLFDVAEQK